MCSNGSHRKEMVTSQTQILVCDGERESASRETEWGLGAGVCAYEIGMCVKKRERMGEGERSAGVH
jgi:hypothetical protein